MLRHVFALAALWCFPVLGFAAGDGFWIDVGNGCKSNFSEEIKPGEKYRWVGPCKDGLSEGLGYMTIESSSEKYIWRHTNRGGYVQEGGTGYSRFDGAIWRGRPGAKNWEQITTGDLPAYARAYLMEGKRPARLKQPEEVAEAARQSGDAGLKRTIEKSRVSTRGGQAQEWVEISPGSEIDIATMSVTVDQPDIYSVFERYSGRYSRIFVTCGPFAWGQHPQRLSPVDHAVPYQVGLAREVCRRSTLAAANPVVPAYVTPPYQTLMSQGRHAEAFQAARKASESGNAAWLREVAWHHWNGSGGARDDAEGTRLYRRAAEGGDAMAMNQLGFAMQNGKGTARDQAGAIAWLKRSAELGNPYAMINLAWAYEGGNGVAQDLDLALKYAHDAKQRNHKDADRFIASITNAKSQQGQAEADSRERLAQIEREERREARRQEREEREERDRQWMDTAQTLMQGAAALKRQQDEQNARRQAERARIESDNARYRQAQAEDSRRWAEQNQRMQQAAMERQRVEQERQRVEEARREEERRRPRKQRVNLPKHTGCIRLEWGKNIPQNNDQWYTLHNTCAYPLEVHWCDRPGCQRSTAAATIRSGGQERSWLLKKNGVSVTVVAACQTANGGESVLYDSRENQCWSMVTMN